MEETKVTEAPVEEVKEVEESKKPEATADEPLIETSRDRVEKQVADKNSAELESNELPEEVKEAEEEKEESKEEGSSDEIEKIKQSVQKRINKAVAKQKSAEERLAEAEAEIERLKSGDTNKPEEKPAQETDAPPTVEQVEAYIIKMKEEGNVKEEVAATRYLIKLEKENALREVREAQEKEANEAKSKADKQQAQWVSLQKDYAVYQEDGRVDTKHDLCLSNQNGLLYKTALSLYQDKELHAEHYNDPDTITGFRRAVSDAYREIHQQGLYKAPREVKTDVKRVPRTPLAEPSSDLGEDTESPRQSTTLSDAEKVREEIRNRRKRR